MCVKIEFLMKLYADLEGLRVQSYLHYPLLHLVIARVIFDVAPIVFPCIWRTGLWFYSSAPNLKLQGNKISILSSGKHQSALLSTRGFTTFDMNGHCNEYLWLQMI